MSCRLDRTRTSPLLVLVLFIAVAIVTGCTSAAGPAPGTDTAIPATTPGMGSPAIRVEVIHFHLNQQCTSCIAVGNLAEETVTEYFPDELASGNLTFRHINIEDPANEGIVREYQVTGSSLWITRNDATGTHRMQDLDVWYLTDDKARFKAYLKDEIRDQLTGTAS